MSKEKNPVIQSFGAHVRTLRVNKSMTQIEVSSAMNRDQQSLQRVESGRVNPSLLYLLDLAEALGVEVKELFEF